MKSFARILVVALAAALAGPAASAQAVSGGEFTVACSYDHMLPDDPIVFPGGQGMSHSHDFAGNRTTDAFATNAGLLDGGSTCTRAADRSAYWVPTLLKDGVPFHAREFRAYYRSAGFDGRVVQPFPKGLRMIAGSSKVTDAGPYQPTSIASWACTIPGGGKAGDEVEVDSIPADCGGQPLRARLVFPQCWNGTDLDSADHKSHMAYAVHGKCPADHPVVLPQLTLSIRYWVPDTNGLALASGGTHSLHADFMLAWAGSTQEDLVGRCINAGVKCGNTATPPSAAGSPAPSRARATMTPAPSSPIFDVRRNSRAAALLCDVSGGARH
ncbi:MAG: hypothetical protein QOG63_54 [Thermoleophilaceae bacterium]|nr:hypothetical protein [Thermoleophilaceae bacterium]